MYYPYTGGVFGISYTWKDYCRCKIGGRLHFEASKRLLERGSQVLGETNQDFLLKSSFYKYSIGRSQIIAIY